MVQLIFEDTMKTITIPYSYDNYGYLLVDEKSSSAAAIDPGEAYPVMAALEKNNAVLKKIFCTHHHQDHVGGIRELLKDYPKIEVICHAADKGRIDGVTSFVEHGDTVALEDFQGSVLHTPGHTLGSVCYRFSNALFTGDTVFGGGCGRLFEGSAEQMFESLHSITAACDDSTNIFFAHEYTGKNLEFALQVEPENNAIHKRLLALRRSGGTSTPSTLRLEKETNPFFRSSQQEIKKGLILRGIADLRSERDVFAQLRLLRNSF